MEFVQKFTPLDFNSFSKKKTQKMSENGEIYTAGNKFCTPAGTDGMDKFHLWESILAWSRFSKKKLWTGLREDVKRKVSFSLGHCPKKGGLAMPDFLPFLKKCILGQ